MSEKVEKKSEFLIKLHVDCIIEKNITASSLSDALAFATKCLNDRLVVEGWDVLDSEDRVAGIDSSDAWKLGD